MEELKLTDEQKKAAKSVYRAIRKAAKLGVGFWDNYGVLEAYNSNAITCPVPDEQREFRLSENPVTYWENLPLGAFLCGNADDPLFFDKV